MLLPGEQVVQKEDYDLGLLSECVHLSYVEIENPDSGAITESFVEQETYDCGFKQVSSRERMLGDERVIVVAQFRLPLEAEGVVTPQDRLKLTKRFGRTLTRQPIYQVVGEPASGAVGIVTEVMEVRL